MPVNHHSHAMNWTIPITALILSGCVSAGDSAEPQPTGTVVLNGSCAPLPEPYRCEMDGDTHRITGKTGYARVGPLWGPLNLQINHGNLVLSKTLVPYADAHIVIDARACEECIIEVDQIVMERDFDGKSPGKQDQNGLTIRASPTTKTWVRSSQFRGFDTCLAVEGGVLKLEHPIFIGCDVAVHALKSSSVEAQVLIRDGETGMDFEDVEHWNLGTQDSLTGLDIALWVHGEKAGDGTLSDWFLSGPGLGLIFESGTTKLQRANFRQMGGPSRICEYAVICVGQAAELTVRDSWLEGTQGYAIESQAEVDAVQNYWGSPLGPTVDTAAVLSGLVTGSRVTSNVQFTPHLTTPP